MSSGQRLIAPAPRPGAGVTTALSAPRPDLAVAGTRLRAKLEIGSVDDPLEREADRVARRVLGRSPRAAPPDEPAPGPRAAGRPVVRRGCAPCAERDEPDEPVRLKSTGDRGSAVSGHAPPSVHEVLRSSGSPLDATTRAFMEPRFGYDFSHVRVHADAAAARSAAAVGAAAYSVGPHIAFAAGRYVPATAPGRLLLAHELAHVVQHRSVESPLRRQQPITIPSSTAATCATTYRKATSFAELIDLVRAAEAKLTAAGITTPKDQIHALRGIYYGTTWSADYAVEKSATRNEGFQRFTRPSEDPAKTVPPDVRSALDCGLFAALQQSQDLIDPGGRQVDLGHLIIGLDARFDPALTSTVKYPVTTPLMTINVSLGGTGTELVTWLGDLGGGAASLALKRVATPSTSARAVFTGTDYGGPINLEGDVAASVVATGSPTALTAPTFAAGKRLSDALRDYLSPAAASAAWTNRATTFLKMNGATFDSANALTNRAALITSFAAKIQEFACNYLASRVKDKKVTIADAKAAANSHVVSSAQEVATAFVDALDDSHKTGASIAATRFPTPTTGGASACTTQLLAAQVLGP